VAAAAGGDYRQRAPADVRVLVVGATGYIGKFVVKELVARGYNVVAFAREKSGIGGKQGQEDVRRELAGADVRFGDVGSMDSLSAVAFKDKVDVVVSCLASRTGARRRHGGRGQRRSTGQGSAEHRAGQCGAVVNTVQHMFLCSLSLDPPHPFPCSSPSSPTCPHPHLPPHQFYQTCK
jgi:hypothetical protein